MAETRWIAHGLTCPPRIFIIILPYCGCWNIVVQRVQVQRLFGHPTDQVCPCRGTLCLVLKLCEVQEAWYYFGKPCWEFQPSTVEPVNTQNLHNHLHFREVCQVFISSCFLATNSELSWRFSLMPWTNATIPFAVLLRSPPKGQAADFWFCARSLKGCCAS